MTGKGIPEDLPVKLCCQGLYAIEIEDIKNYVRGKAWPVCAVGLDEFSITILAMIMGGHVIVCFEDNIYGAKGLKRGVIQNQLKKW